MSEKRIYYIELLSIILGSLSCIFIIILYIQLCRIRVTKKIEEINESFSYRETDAAYYDESKKKIKIGLGNHYMLILTVFNLLYYLIDFIIVFKKNNNINNNNNDLFFLILESFKFFFKLNSFCWITLISHLLYKLNKNPNNNLKHKNSILYGLLYSLLFSIIFVCFFFYCKNCGKKNHIKKFEIEEIYSNILLIVFFLFIIANFIYTIFTLIISVCYLNNSSIQGNESYIKFIIIYFIFPSLLFLLTFFFDMININNFEEIIKVMNHLLGIFCSVFCFFFFKSVISCFKKDNNDNDDTNCYKSIDLTINVIT